MARHKRRFPKTRTLAFAGFVLIMVFAGAVSVWAITLDIPDFSAFEQRKIVQSTKIYDRTGEILLFDVHGDIKRTIVAFDKIPRHVKNATVAIEDSNFYHHKGIDIPGILRSAFRFVVNFGPEGGGGSTITQQLVKNALLTPERTFARKLKEMILAFKVEQNFSKEQILNLYLNEIPYGSSSYGIGAASQTFFGKDPESLTLVESAYLAALPKAPTYYSPYGSNEGELKTRKNLVLERMLALDFITDAEYDNAKKEQVSFVGRDNSTIKAPHFVFFVKEKLAEKYGEDAVENGGLKVTTTLDWEMQKTAENLTEQFVEDEEEKFGVFNAGLVATDPKTGQILTMVGSKNWFADPEPEGCRSGLDCKFEPKVNVSSYGVGRQPGSAFKPFVYATAFKKGYVPSTTVFDLETEFNPLCHENVSLQQGKEDDPDNPCYHPKNYDDVFRGPVSLRDALAQSINVPAVKTLYLSGLNDSLKTSRDLGITTLDDPGRYGLTLVLGGGEVTLLEMVGAYGVFANEGVKHTQTSILKVEDSGGNVLEEYRVSPREVLDPQVARLINDVLSDNDARTPAFGARSPLYFPGRDVAAKTGTTNNSRDAWVIGYTPDIAWGVWFGNNDNSEMVKSIAGFIAAPLWNEFFNQIKDKVPVEKFKKPDVVEVEKPILKSEWRGGKSYVIDTISGKLATEFTPDHLREEKVVTEVHSILHWVDKTDPRGPEPENPQENPQYKNWEYSVREWVKHQRINEGDLSQIPTKFDDVHIPENFPKVSFVNRPEIPASSSGTLSFSVIASGRFPIEQVDVLFGDKFIASDRTPPYSFGIDLGILGPLGSSETLMVNVYDSVGNKTGLQEEIVIP